MVFDVIVVGAGIWGAASVDACKNAGRSVLWVYDDDDVERPTAASVDLARIVRAEYSDPAYRMLAKGCLEAFKTEPRYSMYFHQSGWFLVQDEQQARRGSISGGTMPVSIEEFRRKFPAANVGEDLRITTTKDVGWVEANNLLQAMMRATVAEGRVNTRRGTVTSLILDGSSCRGVRLGKEEVLGKMVILATGWRANRFLASHDLPLLDYRVVGVPVLGIQLTHEQYARYQDMPILCHPGKGEILPPTVGRIMRINVSRSFSLDSSAEVPSHIPSTHHCFKESWDLLATYCEDLTKCQVVISKMCCDALTDSQSFCIRQIERASNAYYVGGGSFHSWKFRPLLPGLIAARLGMTGDNKSEELWTSLTQEQSKKHADLVPTMRWE